MVSYNFYLFFPTDLWRVAVQCPQSGVWVNLGFRREKDGITTQRPHVVLGVEKVQEHARECSLPFPPDNFETNFFLISQCWPLSFSFEH